MLNRAAATPFEDWDGITVGRTPMRVFRILLNGRGLTGSIPVEPASLSNLAYLQLARNELTGPIPPELRNLDGRLTGEQILEVIRLYFQ